MYEAFEVCNQLSIPILAFKYSKFPEDKKIREKFKKKIPLCFLVLNRDSLANTFYYLNYK